MCSNVKNVIVGVLMHPAIMFMNSNKSESNLRKIIQANRQKCSVAGIALMNETIVNKGPNRDIDRDAVNMLITRLISGQYDTVVVERLTDITTDKSDLDEFMHDATNIGVSFFELSTMQYHIYEVKEPHLCLQSRIIIRKDQYGAEVRAADEDKERRHSVCRFGRTVSGKYAGRYAPRGGGQ